MKPAIIAVLAVAGAVGGMLWLGLTTAAIVVGAFAGGAVAAGVSALSILRNGPAEPTTFCHHCGGMLDDN